jgi:hypothetical protein
MSTASVSKDDGKKTKNNRNESGQRSQHTQIVTQSSKTVEPIFQPREYYDEHFPPLDGSSLSQASSSSHQSFQVCIIVLFFGFYLFLFFIF